jgi:hypothetical protein
MIVTALYRISTNEVIKISVKGQSFDARDVDVFGVLTNPTTPDGTHTREDIDGTWGPIRQLGYAKIAEPGPNNVRNATQLEIDTFAAGELDDNNQLDADQAANLYDENPLFRKVLKAMIRGLLKEDNRVRNQWETFKSDVLASSNLGDLKTAVTGYSALPPTTMEEAHGYILSQISKDD